MGHVPLTAKAMESVFLQALFACDILIDRIGRDVRGYGAVECRIKEGNRFGAGEGRYACLDYREGPAIMSAREQRVWGILLWKKYIHIQRCEIGKLLYMVVGLF